MKFSIKYSLAGNMHTSVDILVKNLFQKNSLHDVLESELEEYIQKFPFAAVGHLLLTKKKKEAGSDYHPQATKAALFVSNPLWIQALLHDRNDPSNHSVKTETITDPGVTRRDQNELPTESINHSIITTTVEPEIDQLPKDLPMEEVDSEILPDLIEEADSNKLTNSEDPELPVFKTDLTKFSDLKTNEELSFEPYHTIDYFASQGIKLRAEDLTKDKFGRQLKSFTEWLRTMKKVGPAATEGGQVTAIDETIQKKAEASVENNEVETEAMAEVWAKQGKTAKAIEIYQKLSLHNPSKSHYFAAKIEQLNAQ